MIDIAIASTIPMEALIIATYKVISSLSPLEPLSEPYPLAIEFGFR